MFLSADGSYVVGDFDRYHFRPQQEKRSAYAIDVPHAEQPFAGTGKRILVKWLKTWNKQEPYTGSMSIKKELGLTERAGQYLLTTKFTENHEKQKQIFMELEHEEEIELRNLNGRGAIEIEITWDMENLDERALELLFGRETLRY